MYDGIMSRSKARKLLENSTLFEESEIKAILKTVRSHYVRGYTIGNVLAACGVVGVTLTGNDYDILINTLYFDEEV